MGCSASVMLFEGLRTLMERNCSYVCKAVLELPEPMEDDDTLSRGDSLLWTSTATLVKRKCVCVCVSLGGS